ncbi:MAG: hypothetical protein IE885_04730 [Campylobacterales bacterium]|nr:hypothetical protein [Campylobacterales bacterium]
MKSETQASKLARLMQDRSKYPEYELALPLFGVRKSALKKLALNDVLLLGLGTLELVLIENERIKAAARVEKGQPNTLKIIYLSKDTLQQVPDQKYKIVKCSFGKLPCKKLEIGHTCNIAMLNLQEVELFVEGNKLAAGSLVNVDEEIAIQISKVKKK